MAKKAKQFTAEPIIIEEPIVEEPKGIEFSQFEIDEMILLRKILVDNISAPVFAIIRDNLDDNDPNRWNSVLQTWTERNMYIPIIPGSNIRDGYVTEAGKLHARNKYGIY